MIVKLFSRTTNLRHLIEEGIISKRKLPKGNRISSLNKKLPELEDITTNYRSSVGLYETPGFDWVVPDSDWRWEHGLINVPSREANEIYNNYKRAMTRKRSYIYEGLPYRLDSKPFFALKDPDSMGMIIGFYEHGIFTPSHFAPTNIKNGVKLAEMSKESSTPILYAVPDDLSEMLIKTGGHAQYGQIPQIFNGEIVTKNLVGNHKFNQMLNNPVDREEIFEMIKEKYPEITKEEFNQLFKPTIIESKSPNRVLKDIDLEKIDSNDVFGKFSSLYKSISNNKIHSGTTFKVNDLIK
jgi:hypothetical protein